MRKTAPRGGVWVILLFNVCMRACVQAYVEEEGGLGSPSGSRPETVTRASEILGFWGSAERAARIEGSRLPRTENFRAG